MSLLLHKYMKIVCCLPGKQLQENSLDPNRDPYSPTVELGFLYWPPKKTTAMFFELLTYLFKASLFTYSKQNNNYDFTFLA